MVNPRYDPERNESRHGATDDAQCLEMESRQGWKLLRTEPVDRDILEVDCIFEGETEFPRPYHETINEKED
jgi:hypothetical protein